jgi:hypothetical protein
LNKPGDVEAKNLRRPRIAAEKDHCLERDQLEYESPRLMGGAGAGMDPLKDFSEAARKELRQGQLVQSA